MREESVGSTLEFGQIRIRLSLQVAPVLVEIGSIGDLDAAWTLFIREVKDRRVANFRAFRAFQDSTALNNRWRGVRFRHFIIKVRFMLVILLWWENFIFKPDWRAPRAMSHVPTFNANYALLLFIAHPSIRSPTCRVRSPRHYHILSLCGWALASGASHLRRRFGFMIICAAMPRPRSNVSSVFIYGLVVLAGVILMIFIEKIAGY